MDRLEDRSCPQHFQGVRPSQSHCPVSFASGSDYGFDRKIAVRFNSAAADETHVPYGLSQAVLLFQVYINEISLQ